MLHSEPICLEADNSAMSIQMDAPSNALQESIPLPSPREVDLPAYVRANGVLQLSVTQHSKHGYQREVHEEGTARLRFPRRHNGPLQAMMMNVAGGVAGGDQFSTFIKAGDNVALSVSTPAAERVYRSAGAAAKINVKLKAEHNSLLGWVPQETILFDGAKLDRNISVDCNASAQCIFLEMLVLGRRESGETFTSGEIHDRWDIRLDGRLVMAERLRLTSDVFARSDHPAFFGTAHAFATIVIIIPNGMDQLDQTRMSLKLFTRPEVEAAATAYSGVIVIRLRSTKAGVLKAMVGQFLTHSFPAVMPRSF